MCHVSTCTLLRSGSSMKHLRNSNLVDPVDLWDVSSVQSSGTFGYMILNIYIYIYVMILYYLSIPKFTQMQVPKIFLLARETCGYLLVIGVFCEHVTLDPGFCWGVVARSHFASTPAGRVLACSILRCKAPNCLFLSACGIWDEFVS